MRGVLVAVCVLAVGLSGCVIGTPPEPDARVETVVVTQTVTASPPAPPTYFKLDVVFNQLGEPFSLQVQAYTLDSKGQGVYSGAVRSLSVSDAERNTYGEADWPLCNDRMEGLRVKIVGRDGGIANDLQWPGYHCTGAGKQYHLVIAPDGEMRLGSYTGSVQAPPRPAPNIQFTKDDTQDRLTITTAQTGADWGRLGLKRAESDAPYYYDIKFYLNQDVNPDISASVKPEYDDIWGGGSFPIRAGQFLDFCNNDGATSGTVSITVKDLDADAELGTYTFANIAAC